MIWQTLPSLPPILTCKPVFKVSLPFSNKHNRRLLWTTILSFSVPGKIKWERAHLIPHCDCSKLYYIEEKFLIFRTLDSFLANNQWTSPPSSLSWKTTSPTPKSPLNSYLKILQIMYLIVLTKTFCHNRELLNLVNNLSLNLVY